jgi:hypothetical protein
MASQPSRKCKTSKAIAVPCVALLLGWMLSGDPAEGQVAAETTANSADSALDFDNIKPVPTLSAGMGFIVPFEGGQPNLDPLISPVILAPLWRNWLIESRDTFESDLATPPGSNAFRGTVEKEVDYLQLDYIASPYATITVGRFLTPFGIYNERLYPIWIRDLQSDPLILPLAVGPSNAGTGAMVRGGFSLNPKVTLNYATYFSTLVTNYTLSSARMAGLRAGIFFPGARLEVGGSYQHLLQDDHSNSFGFHFAWQPPPIPFDVRAEYARTSAGSGYWVESAYRLSEVPFHRDFMGRVQIVSRMQEYCVGSNAGEAILPVNTKMFEFGLNYYFRDNLRFVSSYGRQFAPVVNGWWGGDRRLEPFGVDSFDPSQGIYGGQASAGGNMNVWTVGVTYRFVVPLGPGEIK